jgi:hypothetical protein
MPSYRTSCQLPDWDRASWVDLDRPRLPGLSRALYAKPLEGEQCGAAVGADRLTRNPCWVGATVSGSRAGWASKVARIHHVMGPSSCLFRASGELSPLRSRIRTDIARRSSSVPSSAWAMVVHTRVLTRDQAAAGTLLSAKIVRASREMQVLQGFLWSGCSLLSLARLPVARHSSGPVGWRRC